MKAWAVILPLCLLPVSCGDKPVQPSPEPPALVEDAPGFLGGNAYAHCATICAFGPRHTGSEAYGKQLDYLTTHLQKHGWTVSRQEFTLTDGSHMTNLHAVFGPADGARPLLISCHIDTKRLPDFIGADDGASAAAAMVELARVLARTPELAGRVELAFFDGEESFSGRMNRQNSLFGSRYDVAQRVATGTLPRWQINLDMVGGQDKVIAPPSDDTDDELAEHYFRAVGALHYSEKRWTMHFGSYLDDHIPFMDAGVPTLNLIAEFGDGGWWHTSKDDMRRISAASLEDTGKLVLQLIRQLLQEA